MVKCTTPVIKRAFQERADAYPQWSTTFHSPAWKFALSAFDQRKPSPENFDALYEKLKSDWRVFRNGKALGAKEVYQLLSDLPKTARRLRLSELKDGHSSVLRQVVDKAKTIKTNKDGSSLMAMSKFLHFWNPRLFIIVDRWAMADNVLRRLWILRSLPEGFSPDADHYVELLQWAGHLLRKNPAILRGFRRHIRRQFQSVADMGSLPAKWETYEAVAIEWFLEGVVELPPAGVTEAG